MITETKVVQFSQLALSEQVLDGLKAVGYESPSPIQAATIPLILEGKDVVGQAQTGTGKTAAFALPILSKINSKLSDPQVLVLTPTRELAIQVAEAFKTYAAKLPGFHVLPIYGGQDYKTQLRALKRGVHVVVGTPGRVMDHMRRGTLKLGGLTNLVLDEADEMLRMGFIDDVEWILGETPKNRQVSLFSATMPTQIRKIATTYLRNPEHVTIKVKTATADTIRQRYWTVNGGAKLDALTRILEAETFDAMLVFVRTKSQTVELAQKLEARGYAAGALNGDIPQAQRERIVQQLKSAKLDIVVATDVAARGLDVGRISHVLNFDLPYDTETYVHRIGRTGRAGKKGDAILFVTHREKRMLGVIEKATRQKIDLMELPSDDIINKRRISKFKEKIVDTMEGEDLTLFEGLVTEIMSEKAGATTEVSMTRIAAALAQQLQGAAPFLLTRKPQDAFSNKEYSRADSSRDDAHDDRRGRRGARPGDRPGDRNKSFKSRDSERKPGRDSGRDSARGNKPASSRSHDPGMQRYKIFVGKAHGVQPTNIVGAIANEADIESRHIGKIDIQENFSFVDLPDGIHKEVFKKLRNVWVCEQKLGIVSAQESGEGAKGKLTLDKRKRFDKTSDSRGRGKGKKPSFRDKR